MVKKRQRRSIERPASIPAVEFEREGAQPLGLEVIRLRELIAREAKDELWRLSRPQRPTFHHLFQVLEGRGSHNVDFTRHRLVTGSVLYAAPGQVQQFGLEPSLEARLIVFEPDFVRRAPSRWSAPRSFPPQRHPTVNSLFQAIENEHRAFDGTKSAVTLLRALMEALIAALEKDAVASQPLDAASKLLFRFEAALEQSFARAHEVSAYAAVLDCSPRTLARVCERATGKSAKRIIDERVLLEARRLLAYGLQSAAEIAMELGFAEPTQFGKFFKRVAGETPAGFRERVRRP